MIVEASIEHYSIAYGNTIHEYYSLYVGEQWPDHRFNWHWFKFRTDFHQILWESIVTGEFLTLDEWRNTNAYIEQMKSY